MKLSDLKWWHWTLATIAVAAVLRVATGGPLPFIGVVGRPGPHAAPAPTPASRPHREPNQGRSLVDMLNAPGMTPGLIVDRALPELNRLTVEARIPNPGVTPGFIVDRALPELNRLTVEARIPNPGKPVALVDQSAVMVRQIARALQGGVSEDSDAIDNVRVLMATQGMDRAGRNEAHLALYAIDFNARDLFALKPDQAPLATVLGLATNIVFNSADAHEAVKQWCAVPANLGQAKDFCALVGKVKGV